MPEEAELDRAIREIRERVRAQYPQGAQDGLNLPDLNPVVEARDAVLGKVAAIGTVNPRRPGLLNDAVQAVKKMVARALGWHVRGQVEFNRATVAGFDAVLEALNETNRALVELGGRQEQLAGQIEEIRRQVRFATDSIGSIWNELAAVRAEAHAANEALRTGYDGLRTDLQATYHELTELGLAWRQKAAATDEALLRAENKVLRTIADLKAVFDIRLGIASEEIQRRLWGDMVRLREEFEALIHTELRLLRQREAAAAFAGSGPGSLTPAAPPLDWAMFAERFRGTEEYVRERQRVYLPLFEKCKRAVLDVGCGRGEFLELMRETAIPARGIDTSAEMAALCRAKGLEVEAADVFASLPALEDGSLGGLFCAHVIEHLPPERVPDLLRLAAAKLGPGGVIAIETPNPECLAIFASHFYLDPTHVRPVPPLLLRFYLEEAGFGTIEMRRFSPAIEGAPELASLPADFREAFFGGLDYALTARKLSGGA